MNLTFIIILIIVIIGFYLYNNNSENFKLLYDSSPQTIGYSNNQYQNIGYNPLQKNIMPPYPTEPDVDYQDYLNEISGYDSGSRSYQNPYYAQAVAAGLDTY